MLGSSDIPKGPSAEKWVLRPQMQQLAQQYLGPKALIFGCLDMLGIDRMEEQKGPNSETSLTLYHPDSAPTKSQAK